MSNSSFINDAVSTAMVMSHRMRSDDNLPCIEKVQMLFAVVAYLPTSEQNHKNI
jgi:hypothetical protein